jgi:hypothetical protein
VSTVRLMNIGFSVVNWKLAPKPGERFITKPWIRVSPKLGMIAPGEVQYVFFDEE